MSLDSTRPAMLAKCAAVMSAGKFGQRTTSDIQRAYDAAPGPPAKGAVQDDGPPSAPPAQGPSSGLNCSLRQSLAHVSMCTKSRHRTLHTCRNSVHALQNLSVRLMECAQVYLQDVHGHFPPCCAAQCSVECVFDEFCSIAKAPRDIAL